MQYRHAFVIGRFQPFHPGHLYLIREAFSYAPRITIGIGSANIIDSDNPYDHLARRRMIETAIAQSDIAHAVEKIVTIDDHPSDEVWLDLAVEAGGDFDVVLGNNEWVNGIFEQAGYPVIRVPFYKREIYEGKKIRARLRREGAL